MNAHLPFCSRGYVGDPRAAFALAPSLDLSSAAYDHALVVRRGIADAMGGGAGIFGRQGQRLVQPIRTGLKSHAHVLGESLGDQLPNGLLGAGQRSERAVLRAGLVVVAARGNPIFACRGCHAATRSPENPDQRHSQEERHISHGEVLAIKWYSSFRLRSDTLRAAIVFPW